MPGPDPALLSLNTATVSKKWKLADIIAGCVRHRIQERGDLVHLFLQEPVEDEVGEVVIVHGPGTHPDAEPGVVLAMQGSLDALEAIVAAG